MNRYKCVEKRDPQRWSPSVKSNWQPCKDFLKGICTKLPCDNWHPPESQNRVVHSATSGRFRTGRVRNNQIKRRKRVVTKMQWLHWQMCWNQFDQYDSQKLRSVTQTSEKTKGPSLLEIQVKAPHHRRPYGMKFEDRSQEEIERQERCTRGDAWRLTKNIYKRKERDKTTFFSPTNEWSLLAPSTIKSGKDNLL